MTTATTRLRRLLPAVAVLGAGAIVLAGCAGGEEGSGGEGTGEFTYFGQTENTTIIGTLESLAEGGCVDAAGAAPLTTDAIPGANWDQQLQLLAGQGALSNMSMAAGTPSLMKEFIENDQVVNISEELEKLGVADKILPAADSTLKALYDSEDLYALPTELNIEGFWYNKTILEENGVEAPATWDDLVDAAATLDAAGVQPFIAAGQDGWPVTRLVGNYILRDLGPDALQKVADGEASLTDPEYVAGADAVAALGAEGYFGAAPGSIDYTTAMNQFLTGGGAFFYMGSWALGNFNNPEENTIGVENIGFAPFPAVEGGAGDISEVPANAGIPVMFTTQDYTEETAEWLKCVVEGYGDTALAESGVITGFAIDEAPSDLPELTTLVQDTIAEASGSVLWFEATFTPEGTTVSQTNGGGLASGTLSGEEFMQLVEAANEG